jgi:acetyl-CoA C-acetyltransferase
MKQNGREVVVLSGVRTAIGSYGGSLKDQSPTDLAAAVTREAVNRAGLEPRDIEHVAFGNVIHTDPADHYLGRVAVIKAGLPETTPGFTLNRLCGSGMEAVVTIAQRILLGDITTGIGGGAECMSRGQYWVPGLRWGQRMNDGPVVDAMVGALTDPFEKYHMGITAENIAEQYGISREDQDKLALSSHQRATKAIEGGLFKDQILPIEIKVKKDTIQFDTDEFVRRDASMETLTKLRPVFKKDGTVTAGNASGINDASAAVVLMERGEAERRGLKPMARLVAYAHAGVDHKVMGMGPVPAVRTVLERAGLSLDDMDLIELNEAFAAQALGVIRELGLSEDRPNPNGSGISLGHPIGATGTILAVKTVYELQRTGGRYGLATMCIGGGQGIAAIFERM